MKQAFYFILFLFLLSSSCYADGYWLELEGSGKKGDTLIIKIRYGGVTEEKYRYINNGEKLNKMKDFEVAVITPQCETVNIPFQQYEDCWKGFYIPIKEGVYQIFATDKYLPVVVREDSLQNIKPIQYLNATYTVNKGKKRKRMTPYMGLEVDMKNETAIITPFIDGKRVKNGILLRVFFPNNKDLRLTITADGNVSFPTPAKGLYIIRLDKYNDEQGIIDGRKYYTVRHRYDYSLFLNRSNEI